MARSGGGPSEAVRQLIPAQRALGIEPSLVTTAKDLDDVDRVDIAPLEPTILHHRTSGGLTYVPNAASALERHMSVAQIVHVHGFQSHLGTVAMGAARGAHLPYAIEPHGALNAYHWRERRVRKRLYFRLMDRTNVLGAARLIVSSPGEEAQALDVLTGIPTAIVPLGIERRLLQLRRTRRSGPANILFLSRIAQKKRLDLVIEAVSILTRRGMDMTLTVAGPMEGGLGYVPQKMSRDLGIADRVIFIGNAGADARAALLAEAHLYVLMSEDESFGMAVAEALGAGLPVITSAHVGIAGDAENAGALVIAEMNPVSLADSIADVVLHPDSANRLGAAARRYASERFTWEAAAKATLEAYELARNGGGR